MHIFARARLASSAPGLLDGSSLSSRGRHAARPSARTLRKEASSARRNSCSSTGRQEASRGSPHERQARQGLALVKRSEDGLLQVLRRTCRRRVGYPARAPEGSRGRSVRAPARSGAFPAFQTPARQDGNPSFGGRSLPGDFLAVGSMQTVRKHRTTTKYRGPSERRPSMPRTEGPSSSQRATPGRGRSRAGVLPEADPRSRETRHERPRSPGRVLAVRRGVGAGRGAPAPAQAPAPGAVVRSVG